VVLIHEKILGGKKDGKREILSLSFNRNNNKFVLNYKDELEKKEKETSLRFEDLEREFTDFIIDIDNPEYSKDSFKLEKEFLEKATKYVSDNSIKSNKKDIKKTETSATSTSTELPKNNSETSVISETSETSDTSDTSPLVSLRTCFTGFLEVFQENMKDKILKHFLTTGNKPLSVGDLAEVMGEKKDSVRTALNRNKQYFSDTSTRGVSGVTQVTQVGIDEIQSRIDQKLLIQAQAEKNKERAKQEELVRKNYSTEIQNFIQSGIIKREGKVLNIDFNELSEHNIGLSENLLSDPKKFITMLEEHFDNLIDIRIHHLPDSVAIPIENIRVKHSDKIICVDGRITSFGEVKPIILAIKYDCVSCGTILTIHQDYKTGQIKTPYKCSCGNKRFIENSRVEVDACFLQLEDLQEKTDNPHAQRVRSVIMNGLTKSKHIKTFTPGNEVRVTGILRKVPKFKNQKETVFSDWIFEIMSADLIEKDIDINSFSDELVEEIQNLSAKIDAEGFDSLIESFAPEVYGYNDIKLALALQLANRRNDVKTKSTRNKSNILLMGDPGVAKSVMCDFAVRMTSGGRKAVGGGSSAVGITASVVKEDDSLGGYRVEPGAMILAKDILFIDEMNNLTEDDKPRLQEGMNEQRISIDKANLHVKMPVTCGILAAANPKHGHFKESSAEPVAEQFNIPTPILNRFDTIFVLKDKIDSRTDELIAERMIERHRGIKNNTYDEGFLKNFFAYIKLSDEPTISSEMQNFMKKVYQVARETAYSGVCINPRFLESLTRMSIASAKLRQSKTIDEKDIGVALRVLAQSQYKVSETIILTTQIQKI